MKRWKSYIAYAVVSCMIFGSMPLQALAEEATEEAAQITSEEEVVTTEEVEQETIETPEISEEILDMDETEEEVVTEETTEEFVEEDVTEVEVEEEPEEASEESTESTQNVRISNANQCGDEMFWDYDEDTMTLKITGRGEMYDYDWTYTPWYELQDSVDRIVIESGITSITDYCFYGFIALREVELSDTLTYIPSKAFYQCRELSDITLPESVRSIHSDAFTDSALAEITILNKNLEYIGYQALGYNHAEDTVTEELVKSDKFIIHGYRGTLAHSYAKEHGFEFDDLNGNRMRGTCGDSAYWSYSESDATLYIRGSGRMYDYDTYDALPEIPHEARGTTAPWAGLDYTKVEISGLENIGRAAFAGYTSTLKEVVIEGDMTEIGDYAFDSCNSLETINIPETVTRIGNWAFYYCVGLEEVTLPAGLTEIEDNVFLRSWSLKHVNLENVKKIGEYAFSATALEEINLSSELTVLGERSFSGCQITAAILPDSITALGNGVFADCNSLEKVQLPSNIKTIPKEMFRNTAIEQIALPDSVTSIGESAFFMCEKLNNITLPNNLTSIGASAFAYCDSLTEITMPGGVGNIGERAFDSCQALETVTIYNKNAKIGDYAFGYDWNNELIENNLVMQGYSDSTAETYAKTNHIDFYAFDKVENIKNDTISITSAALTKNGVALIWSTTKNADTYKVYRKTGSGKYSLIQTKTAGGKLYNTYTDTSVKSGTSYTYKVVASYQGIDSKAKEKSVYYLAEPEVTLKRATTGITVSWKKVTGASGYYIYRKVLGGKYVKVTTAKASATSYLDKKATKGKINVYKVYAYKSSPKVNSSYTEKQILFLLPTKLTLSRTSIRATRISLKWTKVAGAKGYYIYRKSGKGSYKKIATIKSASTLKYTDKTVKKGTKYTYTVRPYNGKEIAPYIAKTK